MKTYKILIPLIVILVLLMWIGSAVFAFYWYGKPDNPGIWGDTFGAINALFSGLALAGVAYAIVLQQKEIESQRIESEQSKAQLAEQNRLITEQLKSMQAAYDFDRRKANAEASPMLRLESSGGNRVTRALHFKNTGGRIVTLSGSASHDCTVTISHREGIQTNGDFSVEVLRMSPEDFPDDVLLSLQCIDTLGNLHDFVYQILKTKSGYRIEQGVAGYRRQSAPPA